MSTKNGKPSAGPLDDGLQTPRRAGQYRCIVVDPPWDQGKTGKRACRPNQGETLDYKTMSPAQIRALPIGEWAAPECFLWLWATNSRSRSSGAPVLQIAFDLLEAWGFRFYTLLTWNKRTGPCPFGPYQITTEHVVFAYRGRANFPRECLGKMKTMFASEKRGRVPHSTKPDELYRHIQQWFETPRLDVFARQKRRGFDGWGDECQS